MVKKRGGGAALNQVIFRFLVLFLSLFGLVHVTSTCRFVLYLFFLGASVYAGGGGGGVEPGGEG